MLKRAGQPSAPTEPIEPCPYCRRTCDVVRSGTDRYECMSCGSLWVPRIEYQLQADPRQELEDPDDRPYLWDLE